MSFAVLVDFGSTYTKMVCVDMTERRVVATDKFPSTVHEDALIGLSQCFDAAKAVIGEDNFSGALKLSTSSAAGGLRMAVSGLTESLSIQAGRNASFSAGAKIVHTAVGLITDDDVEAIQNSGAEILLFCGGYEGGNVKLMLQNAEKLAESRLSVPVIYAGNSSISEDVRRMFISRGKECFLAENIIPAVGKLNTEPTAKIIRNLFMNRITNMKGVGEVQTMMDGPIVPTPAAVLAAGELLSKGTLQNEGLGSFMMADIGGATTDIYSFAENQSYSGAKCIGVPEPYAKRTVEGDLGMRESSICLLREVGAEGFARECGLTKERIEEAIARRITYRDYVADNDEEKNIDFRIAENAVRLSARRHAGTANKEFFDGCRLVQRGKNLTEIGTVIGTGGILVNNREEDAFAILENVQIREGESGSVLLPEKVKTLVDREYVFFAAGLLRDKDEDAALAMMKHSIGIN